MFKGPLRRVRNGLLTEQEWSKPPVTFRGYSEHPPAAPALVRRDSTHQQKNLFLRTDKARFRTTCVRSLRPILPDLPCLLCLSSLASGAPGRPTFPPQSPTRLLRPHPLLVPPPCIRPLNLSSTGLLPTPCSCARPAAISATLPPLAT